LAAACPRAARAPVHPAGGAPSQSGVRLLHRAPRGSCQRPGRCTAWRCAARCAAALPHGHCWHLLARCCAAAHCGVLWHADARWDVDAGGPPQVCRTYNYGEQGSSRGQFYRRYLQPIRLNDEDIAWEGADLSYLDKRRRAARRRRTLPAPTRQSALPPACDRSAVSIAFFAAWRAEAAKPQAYALAGSDLRQAPCAVVLGLGACMQPRRPRLSPLGGAPVPSIPAGRTHQDRGPSSYSRVRAGTRRILRWRWAPRAWCAARARRRPPSATSCSPTPARRAPPGGPAGLLPRLRSSLCMLREWRLMGGGGVCLKESRNTPRHCTSCVHTSAGHVRWRRAPL